MVGQLVRAGTLAVVAVAANFAQASDDLKHIGEPPVFGTVVFADGKGAIGYTYRNPGNDVYRPTLVRCRNRIAADSDEQAEEESVCVFNVEGRRLKKDEAVKLLVTGSPIMVCPTNDSLDKFYRQHLKADLLILIGPKRSQEQLLNFTMPGNRPWR